MELGFLNWIKECFFSLTTQKKKVFYILLLIAIVTRLFNIYNIDIWYDEVFDYYTSSLTPFFDLFVGRFEDPAHPPLFFIFNKVFSSVSMNYIWLRLPNFTLGILAFCFLALFLLQILNPKSTFHWWILGVSLFGFALFPKYVHLSILAQSYPMSLFFGFLSCCLLYRYTYDDILFDKVGKTKIFFIFSLLGFINFYTEYANIWFFVTWFTFLLFGPIHTSILTLNQAKRLFFLLFSSLIGSLFWLPSFLRKLETAFSYEDYIGKVSGYGTSEELFRPILFWLDALVAINQTDALYKLSELDMGIYSIIIASLSFIGLLTLFSFNKRAGLFFIFLLFFPVLFSHTFSLLISPIIHSRNLYPVGIASIVGLGSLFVVIGGWIRFKYLPVLLCLLWTWDSIRAYDSLYYRPPELIGGKEVIQSIHDQVGDGPLIVFSGHQKYKMALLQFHAELLNRDFEFVYGNHTED